jgi:hypothetical protein
MRPDDSDVRSVREKHRLQVRLARYRAVLHGAAHVQLLASGLLVSVSVALAPLLG